MAPKVCGRLMYRVGSRPRCWPQPWARFWTRQNKTTRCCLLIMSLLCWRWTFKIAVTLLVFWAALGACEMITLAESGRAIGVTPRTLMAFLLQSDNWALLVSRITLFTLLHGAVVPAALLWTGTLRRIPFNQNLTINAIILIASYGLLLLTRGLIGHAIPSVIDPLAIFQAP